MTRSRDQAITSPDALLAHEFPIEDHFLYLNHAAVAPWPRRTAAAVTEFASENVNRGASHYPDWMQREQRLRAQLAGLINADSPDDIALLKNTSEALSVVAHGFPWTAGDNVVISDEEFPSNRIVWESLGRYGVEVRQVCLKHPAGPEAALLAAADERTRLVSISSVEYASGLRLDLIILGNLCKQRGIALCVDAIQGLGAVPHDVQAMQIDFLMADGHKWLLGPEGIAVFYCRPVWRERLTLQQYGWHMVEDHLNFDIGTWRPAASARRFECGSPNMLGIYGLSASVSLLMEIGIAEIERRILARTEQLFEAITHASHLELLTDPSPGRYAGIVTFRHNKVDNETLFQHLRENKVICAKRGGGIRFSPHCYTRPATVEAAMRFTRVQ